MKHTRFEGCRSVTKQKSIQWFWTLTYISRTVGHSDLVGFVFGDFKAAAVTVMKHKAIQWFGTLTYIFQNVGHSDLVLCLVIDIEHKCLQTRFEGCRSKWNKTKDHSMILNFDLYIPESRSQWPSFVFGDKCWPQVSIDKISRLQV